MINGKEAINNPAAGEGTPRKLFDWLVLILNFANRHATAQVYMNAGTKEIKETSNPFSSCANPKRSNWYKIIPGATPKLTTSHKESSCFPFSEFAFNSL